MTFSAGSRSNRRPPIGNRPTTANAPLRPTRSRRDQPAQSSASTAAASRRRNVRSRNQPFDAARSARASLSKLHPLILPTDVPPWLRTLLQVQQGVWISTIVLSSVALGVYGWSVYSQQQWGKAYSQLERLQRNERQLIANKEMMKNQIAQQVDPAALGLAPQKSNEVIFIKPDPNPPQPAAKTDATPTELPVNQPLGY
jgi:hypothetical protein